jgi:hypothetical protein
MESNNMSRPTINITDLSTGQSITREMNDEEFAQHLIDKADFDVRQTEAEAKAAQKAALLERLGITEDEARLLLA